MHTGVDQLIDHQYITGTGQRGDQGDIGSKAIGEKQRGLAPEKRGGLRFQRLMLRRIAAQQARSARANGDAARHRIRHRRRYQRIMREAEIIVGRKVDTRPWLQYAQPVAAGASEAA